MKKSFFKAFFEIQNGHLGICHLPVPYPKYRLEPAGRVRWCNMKNHGANSATDAVVYEKDGQSERANKLEVEHG